MRMMSLQVVLFHCVRPIADQTAFANKFDGMEDGRARTAI